MFKVGNVVRMIRLVGSGTHPAETFFEAVGSVIPGGVFEVTAVVPDRDGERQYRIRGGHPAHERVVREVRIVHAGGLQPRP